MFSSRVEYIKDFRHAILVEDLYKFLAKSLITGLGG